MAGPPCNPSHLGEGALGLAHVSGRRGGQGSAPLAPGAPLEQLPPHLLRVHLAARALQLRAELSEGALRWTMGGGG